MKNLQKKLDLWVHQQEEAYIIIENLNKNYNNHIALKNFSLKVYKGEFFSILGPSGCGKTTLLRILAGFEDVSSGTITIDGDIINNVPPYDRAVNTVFQSYALFPHMTVEQNVAFGLEQEKMLKNEIKQKVYAILDIVHMNKFINRYPHQLSGGQKQRVALARCLVKKPKLVLLDEPLAALDKQLRANTQFELVNIQEKLGVTFIMVTHDQEEAMTMSTRIGIMEEGKLKQIGTPNEIYEYPNSRYTASFIGDINIFEGIVESQDKDFLLLNSPDIENNICVTSSSDVHIGSNIAIAIRPEKLFLSKAKIKNQKYNTTQGLVKEIAYLGDISIYHIILTSGKKVLVSVINESRNASHPIEWDEMVYIHWQPDSSILISD